MARLGFAKTCMHRNSGDQKNQTQLPVNGRLLNKNIRAGKAAHVYRIPPNKADLSFDKKPGIAMQRTGAGSHNRRNVTWA